MGPHQHGDAYLKRETSVEWKTIESWRGGETKGSKFFESKCGLRSPLHSPGDMGREGQARVDHHPKQLEQVDSAESWEGRRDGGRRRGTGARRITD